MLAQQGDVSAAGHGGHSELTSLLGAAYKASGSRVVRSSTSRRVTRAQSTRRWVASRPSDVEGACSCGTSATTAANARPTASWRPLTLGTRSRSLAPRLTVAVYRCTHTHARTRTLRIRGACDHDAVAPPCHRSLPYRAPQRYRGRSGTATALMRCGAVRVPSGHSRP
jgi:hypothetical protein